MHRSGLLCHGVSPAGGKGKWGARARSAPARPKHPPLPGFTHRCRLFLKPNPPPPRPALPPHTQPPWKPRWGPCGCRAPTHSLALGQPVCPRAPPRHSPGPGCGERSATTGKWPWRVALAWGASLAVTANGTYTVTKRGAGGVRAAPSPGERVGGGGGGVAGRRGRSPDPGPCPPGAAGSSRGEAGPG